MPIRFQCNSCSAGFRASDEQAGQQLPCPKCGSVIQVPVAQATIAPSDKPLDETESASLAETQVNPFAGIAEKVTADGGRAAAPPLAPPAATASTPPPAPPAAQPPPPAPANSNAFQSPQAPREDPREVDLTQVKITDIDLPFWSVFKLVFKAWVAALMMMFALWLILAGIMLVLGFGMFAVGL